MPQPRQHLRSKRGWTDEQKVALLGHDFFGVFGVEQSSGHAGPFRDRPGDVAYRLRDDEAARVRERMHEAWEDLRNELLPTWIAERPFTRPKPWWLFDAPEPLRRCLSGQHPFERPEFVKHCEQMEQEYPGYTARTTKTLFGEPCISGPPGLDGKDEFETERDYLTRLDLLTDEERQLNEETNNVR